MLFRATSRTLVNVLARCVGASVWPLPIRAYDGPSIIEDPPAGGAGADRFGSVPGLCHLARGRVMSVSSQADGAGW